MINKFVCFHCVEITPRVFTTFLLFWCYSVSTRRTYAFETPIAKFIYRALKPDLFFGYEIVSYNNKSFKIATIEKAVLDYFYLNPHLASHDDFTSLRFNAETFLNKFRRKKWESFLTKFSNKRLLQRISMFMDTVDPRQEQNYAWYKTNWIFKVPLNLKNISSKNVVTLILSGSRRMSNRSYLILMIPKRSSTFLNI